MTRPIVLWVVLVLCGISWGATQLLSKLVVSEGHHPIGISVLANIVAAVLLGVALLARGRPLPLSRRHLIFYAIVGFLGTALPNTVSYAGMQVLPVGVMSIVISLVPMATFLLAVPLKLERVQPLRVVGVACGTGAVLLLVVPEASLPTPGQAIWVVLPVITALSYAVENVYIARAQPAECDPLHTMCGLTWAALCMLVPLAIATGEWMAPWPAGPGHLAMVAMTVLHLASYGAFVWMIGKAGPVFAAQVAYIVTLSGVFWGVAILGEDHSGWVWLSLALMLAGLSLVQPRR